MSLRQPPRLATWLLEKWATRVKMRPLPETFRKNFETGDRRRGFGAKP